MREGSLQKLVRCLYPPGRWRDFFAPKAREWFPRDDDGYEVENVQHMFLRVSVPIDVENHGPRNPDHCSGWYFQGRSSRVEDTRRDIRGGIAPLAIIIVVVPGL